MLLFAMQIKSTCAGVCLYVFSSSLFFCESIFSTYYDGRLMLSTFKQPCQCVLDV